ncbi:hypothetical protein [Priestia abyssalis]|uniref:hypothetical protein n=1 Tax=Priestia abyssalis TaxID=1221450 RepID=UPI0009951927|nr:hypothetical protein [Priestia abyssalis]
MSKQGKMNKQQSNQQIAKQASDFDAELASEFQGNTKSQSQKKSGKQMNKKREGSPLLSNNHYFFTTLAA